MSTEQGLRFGVVDPGSSAARSAMAQYFVELNTRFSAGFDVDAGGTASDAIALRGPTGAFVLLTNRHMALGCGGIQRHDASTAEIKRMWIHPGWRGRGLGARLLDHLESVARNLGYDAVVLDTNESLTEAVAMYGRTGYRAIERYNDNPYAHHWFAKTLPGSGLGIG